MQKKAILPKSPARVSTKGISFPGQLLACVIGLTSIGLIGFFMSLWQELLYMQSFTFSAENIFFASSGGVIYGFIICQCVKFSRS